MRFRPAIAALLIIVPSFAFALDYDTNVERYTDGEVFTRSEKVSVNLLTELGAVQGYPDGTYRPNRQLNRAEFLKIVLLSHPEAADAVDATIPWDCFPDVHSGDWFAASVCYAKERGIVGGYPDGTFKPAQSVNYAEALKMLAEVYDYPLDKRDGDSWYDPYVRVARDRGTALDGVVGAGQFITRGQMARLAAAFRAEDENELEAFRMEERGVRSSSSSASSISSVASPSSASSASSSSSTASDPGFPAVSHILMFGTMTPALLQGTFTSPSEDVYVRIPELVLRREIKSIDTLYLIDEDGNEIMPLELATANNVDKKIWRWEGTGSYVLPKGQPVILGIRALLKPRGEATLKELWEVDQFRISTTAVANGTSYELVPSATKFPMHQTTQGRITSVTNPDEATGSLPWGSNRKIASFVFTGVTATGGQVGLSSLTFSVLSSGVKLSNLRIGDASEVNSRQCSTDPAVPNTIACDVLPPSLADLTSAPQTLSVFATVTLTGASPANVQLMLDDPGTIGQLGAVKWNDGAGEYLWTDLPKPIAAGTRWTVEP